MMNFDTMINRRNTNSLKYDFALENGKPADVLPLWVADMDFRVPNKVIDALINSSKHGILGYSDTKQEYIHTLKQWFFKTLNWHIKDEWLVKTPGVVFALSIAIQSFTKEEDAVLIQRPVYYPFSRLIHKNHRKLVNSPLIYKNDKYQIDFVDFEQKIIENNVKLFILCSPHNPVGRVWTKEELTKIGDICLKYQVIVIADEIHSAFTYPGHQHIVFASLSPEINAITITCTAPSKTFNLAGLQVSNIFIANENLRKQFIDTIDRNGYSHLNTLGIVACQAAYTYGEEWLKSLKQYLIHNLNFVREFLKEHLPEIKLVEPEGTYLLWLDFSALQLSDEALEDLITHKAKLWLDAGVMFGIEGKQFQRINIACPQQTLEKALLQLKSAIYQENLKSNKVFTSSKF
ncbi:MalY/PatB family protein [Anaerosinus gibii]|uniref:cysteine-S-conjugate beta-lyase n=1 Tax=Selenobaculum gibii TaxID=3054208 RepID=A0A9Y2EU26_9FIRM|nr:MalY/PatB family protein [Selenobaculum gbiensis]WIW70985.1 pyridoxal phosphate-dependent aminotransferase [Selenobaculum gbiensis]